MNIKIINEDPSVTLKARFDYEWSNRKRNLSKFLVIFMTLVISFVCFFYLFNPAYKSGYNEGVLISIILVVISAYLLSVYNKQYNIYWERYNTLKQAIKRKGIISICEINCAGITTESPQVRSEISWAAFKSYEETEDFIILFTKEGELSNNLWINKSNIGQEDLKMLLTNLEDIFDF
jgi:hypothetical protein